MDIAARAQLLHETSERHGAFEAVAPPHDWWDWYAAYMIAREQGSTPDEAAASGNRYMAEVLGVVVPSCTKVVDAPLVEEPVESPPSAKAPVAAAASAPRPSASVAPTTASRVRRRGSSGRSVGSVTFVLLGRCRVRPISTAEPQRSVESV